MVRTLLAASLLLTGALFLGPATATPTCAPPEIAGVATVCADPGAPDPLSYDVGVREERTGCLETSPEEGGQGCGHGWGITICAATSVGPFAHASGHTGAPAFEAGATRTEQCYGFVCDITDPGSQACGPSSWQQRTEIISVREP